MKIRFKKLLQKIDGPKVCQKTFALPDALPLAVVIKVPCSLFLIIYQEKSDFFMNYFSKVLLRKETNYANLLVIEFNSNTFLRTTYVF